MERKAKYVVLGVILFFILLCVSVFTLAKLLVNQEPKDNECAVTVDSIEEIGKDRFCDTTEYRYTDNNYNIIAMITEYKKDFYSINLKVNNKKVNVSFFNDHIDNPIFYKVDFLTYANDLLMIKSNSGAQYDGDYLVIIDKNGNILLELDKKSILVDAENYSINVRTTNKNMYDCNNDKYNLEDIIYTLDKYSYIDNSFINTSSISYTYGDLCKISE